ncbi:DUF6513 domain-containing protein [Rhodopirellula sp. MGV]|uniref:DUF6513 domain-containing protein n=1 Tax=Rhodopirellula sp. MGV TaxID=2023130 RepID=UPI000B973CB1|nr:DUF6513 domain-containing protein [Rhodopirellula sp. MGV]OYP37997.1 dihydropteroate synthase [Rhodopirellula sp. MGV]PNY34369.1 dihydropteroate synthase [Rhodopirellula baltica]
MNRESKTNHYHFVTGKLAASAVRDVVAKLAEQHGFDYSVGVLPITVAALMTPRWIAKHLTAPEETTHLVVPGYCDRELRVLIEATDADLIVGPKDCRDLGQLFGEQSEPIALDRYDIEIIAEINHAPRQNVAEVLAIAKRLVADGADRIDIGCDPASPTRRIGDYVAALVDEGIRVSIDTFDPMEARLAIDAGATLVLSVNSSNRHLAKDWGTEVVVIPDSPSNLDSLDATVEFLSRQNVPMRLDPILEPIGAGLADSLMRYWDTRRRYPELPMMMGIGNLTELSDVDSAGVNLILLGICQELRIESVLTTQVINWAQTSVRECDAARRLVHASVQRGTPPKNMSDALVMLRDSRQTPFSPEMFEELAQTIKDNNYRLFAQDGLLHLVTRKLHLSDPDAFLLFDQLLRQPISDNVDAGHAFYLGYELAKATIALQLGKQYNQDRALRWGMLTQEEESHRLQRTNRHRGGASGAS